MQLTINGQQKEFSEKLTLLDLAKKYQEKIQTLVIELNGEVLPRNQWHQYQLQAGDKIELITFVGGG